jgi:hypothetical protein
MNHLYEAAAELQEFCRQRDWKCCLIGGLAVSRLGRARATRDVDLALLTGFGNEQRFVDELLSNFSGRSANAGEFALQNRVLLIRASNQVPVDIGLAAIGFEESMIARAKRHRFGSKFSLWTATPDDLVVLKAFANRDIDWFDLEGLLVRQAGKLNWGYINQQLAPLCELSDSPDVVDRLRRLRDAIARDQ